jgi:hypothetical protein
MARVHGRIYLAVAAWLLGASAATGGSLVAVSLLGQSLAAPPTQQLTVAAVNRALASDSKQPAAAPTAGPSRSPGHGKTRARAAASPSTAPASPSAAPGAAAGGTLLTSSGGSVVAACGSSGAYLISWSPQQGYLAEDVIRGPAPLARVTFLAGPSGVTMSVSCNASTPLAVITTVRGDDGRSGD